MFNELINVYILGSSHGASVYDILLNFGAEVAHDTSSVVLLQMQIEIPNNNHCIWFADRINEESFNICENSSNIVQINFRELVQIK